MKRILFTLFLSIVFLHCFAQTATNLAAVLAVPRDTFPNNYLYVYKNAGPDLNRIYSAKWDSVKIKPINILWLTDSIYAKGDLRYPQLLGAYSNPAFVNSLSAAKVFGLSAVALTGNYNDLSNLPNLNLKYDASNPAGYISGINSGMIIGALGYTPYDGNANPNNYQSKTVQATDGIMKASSTSADTLKADWNLVMSVQRATDSITSIKASISTKLNISDTTGKWIPSRYLPANFDTLNTNELQTLSKAGNNLSLSLGGGTFSVADQDSSITNEIQTLSGSNRTISLTSGGSYTIPQTSFDSLSNKPTTLSGYGITDGVTNASLASTLSGYATTIALNNKADKSTTLTINGLAQDLSANRAWSVGTLVGSDTTSLSNRINGKEPTITSGTTTQYWRGDKTFQTLNTTIVPEGTNQYWTAFRSNDALTSTAINTAIGGTVLKSTDTTSLSNRINTKVDQAGARSAISLTTTGTSGAATYNSSTGVFNIPNYTTTSPTFNNSPGRSLNTSYQPSTTKNVFCTYSVTISTTLSLLNLNSSGVAYLEISSDNTNWSTINSGGITRTLSVSISVGLNDQTNINLQGWVPANWYVRIRTVTSGGASVSMSSGQETTF